MTTILSTFTAMTLALGALLGYAGPLGSQPQSSAKACACECCADGCACCAGGECTCQDCTCCGSGGCCSK